MVVKLFQQQPYTTVIYSTCATFIDDDHPLEFHLLMVNEKKKITNEKLKQSTTVH
jgi:hypothetical protein